ncbi:MAG: hypothetical protein JWN18_659 [Parcubacteria group bacterium]|nr:hypothetical protein [Parcubacteria group bacterium]
MLSGCEEDGSRDYPKKFQHGQIVMMKLDGRKAMVTDVTKCNKGRNTHHSCSYEVRFTTAVASTTKYDTVTVYDFELALAE